MSARTTSRSQDERTVREWGFRHVFTWTDAPYAHYPPHQHLGLTTHLIRRGTLTITYPDDANPTKETFGVGARIDVPAGKTHEVWMGEEGELSAFSSLFLALALALVLVEVRVEVHLLNRIQERHAT
ncbi:hypothetical protein Z517_02494 [Fonsecaea pedrosoi CBS 271.37]|uniref:Cupin 2 conserved barrel domain-containing protein n=1 Tax=Fonsecaea pedrosoi CBS 271.37 TaxID=1442368 RepID=A0A0D2HFL1_9EURO|nr:uncharacterized protein Z517_02494 [Fonsecaea pedrosoi CBS 271.37]KIW83249.1 hypothetical protein Z517_02494 [Fonsecaea pedrosoi CBS 271.37]